MSAKTVKELCNLIRETALDDGLLINFGSFRFQIKKYTMAEPIAQTA